MIKSKHLQKLLWPKLIIFALVLVLLVCSITVMAKEFTDPHTYEKTIQSIDEKKVTVLGVSAAISGSATILAAVPDDSTTPLANELMDLSSYLAIVVCILVLEKSLLTVFGAVVCYVLIPMVCILIFIFLINNKKIILAWAIKLTILALAVLFLIPISMKLSDYIYEVNQFEIVQEVETSDEIVESTVPEKELSWYKELWNKVTETITNTAEAAVEAGKEALYEFVDNVSVFVIAYCAVPILIILVFLWLIKVLFSINININVDIFNPGKSREKH